jgi:heat-inducible transcriptional repressor
MRRKVNKRAIRVLEAVISAYIDRAEPVGSTALAGQRGLDVSPATIRNVMAQLEEMGFLAQPHTSAGRVPTQNGLRFYLDSILQVKELGPEAKSLMRLSLTDPEVQDVSELLRRVSQKLSVLSRQVAVVAAPDPEQEVFRHIELILLHPGLILVVLVASSGMVQNRIITGPQDLNQEDLDKFTRYLNELLAELNFSEMKKRIAQEMDREQVRLDELSRKALELGRLAMEGNGQCDIYVEGQTNLMDAPEFADVHTLRKVFQALEEKSTLLSLLEKSHEARGVQIFIGADSKVAGLNELTAITAAYGGEGRSLGALGVIGPTRMDYSQVIPVVDYTARLVSEILKSRA